MLRFTGFIWCLGVLLAAPAFAQNAAPSDSTALELKSLRETVELQSKQIDHLSLQMDLLLKKLGAKEMAPAAHAIPHEEASPAPTEAAEPPPKAVPANAQGTHIVSKGETFTSIAKKYGVSVGELMAFNHISDDRHLQIGQNLIIPMAKGASPAPSPTTSDPPTH